MPTVTFVSKLQGARFDRLHQSQAYFERLRREIIDPALHAQTRANLEMNMALAEIGVPVDKRDVRMFVDEGYIFYEDEEMEWSNADGKAVQRSPESKAEWLVKHPKPAVPAAPSA